MAHRLSRGQQWAMFMAITLGLIVACYGFAGSYLTVSTLATQHRLPLPELVPVGVDGGLVAVVVLDLVLSWTGAAVGWLRQLVRLLSVGTIAANVIGGWPDPVAVGLHVAAPMMVLAMVEAGRTVLLRRIGQVRGTRRDAIPLVRWVLAPWRTWLVWRRMVLWQVTRYSTALDAEMDLRYAVGLLRVHYGRRWRRRVPADLVWMLRAGIGVQDVCVRVQALLDGEGATAALGISQGTRTCGGSDERRSGADSPQEKPEVAVPDGQFLQALRVNRKHWADTGRPASAETMRKSLRIGAEQSRLLVRAVRARDRAAVCEAG